MPIQVVVLPESAAPVKPWARNVRSRTGRKRSKLKKPIPHDARASKQHNHNRVTPPNGIGEKVTQMSHPLFLSTRFEPLFRLLQLSKDDQRERRRKSDYREHESPRGSDRSGALHLSQGNTRYGSHHIADSGESLQNPERIGPRPVGHDFRDKRHADRELPAYAEAA